MTTEQIKEIAGNLDMGFQCYIHKKSLEMIFLPDEDKHPGMEMEMWDKEFKAIRKNADKYLVIEGMDSRDSFRVMQSFIDTLDDKLVQAKLVLAINRPKPFANFKFEIDNSGPFRDMWLSSRRKN